MYFWSIDTASLFEMLIILIQNWGHQIIARYNQVGLSGQRFIVGEDVEQVGLSDTASRNTKMV